MRKIEREPNGAGIFKPGQDLVVAGTVGKNGVKAALSAKEKEISARFPEWFVKRIREQADKKSELTPEMLNACDFGGRHTGRPLGHIGSLRAGDFL